MSWYCKSFCYYKSLIFITFYWWYIEFQIIWIIWYHFYCIWYFFAISIIFWNIFKFFCPTIIRWISCYITLFYNSSLVIFYNNFNIIWSLILIIWIIFPFNCYSWFYCFIWYCKFICYYKSWFSISRSCSCIEFHIICIYFLFF